MRRTSIKRTTSLIAITLLSGCTLSPVKNSAPAASDTSVGTYDSEKKTTLKMFVFQKSDREDENEQAGYMVEFEPKVAENTEKNRSVLIYKD